MASFGSNLLGLFTGDPLSSAYAKGAKAATGDITQAFHTAKGDVTRGYDTATTDVSRNLPLYQGATAMAAPALQTYYGAISGDPAQEAAARAAFQASPGYEYTLGQGLEGLSRVGASTGQLGQADMDAMAFAHNLSDQDYQQWLDNLFRGTQQYEFGLTGQAGTNTALGDLAVGKGTNLADIAMQRGQALAGIQGALPVQQAQAGLQGAGNALNALFQIASLPMGGATGAPQSAGGAGLSALAKMMMAA